MDRPLKFFNRLSIVFLVFLFVPFSIILSIYSFNILGAIKNDAISEYDAKLTVFAEEYDYLIQIIGDKFDFLQNYYLMRNIVNVNSKERMLFNVNNMINLNYVVKAMLGSNSSNLQLRIYTDNENIYMPEYFSELSDLFSLEYYNDIDNLNENHTFFAIKQDGEKYLCAYRKYNVSNNVKAVMEISVAYKSLINLSEWNGIKDSSLYCLTDNEKIIGFYNAENEHEVISKSKNTRKYLLMSKKVPANNGTLYLLVSKKIYENKIIIAVILLILANLLVGALIIFVSKLTARLMTKRLTSITNLILNDDIINAGSIAKHNDEFDVIAKRLLDYSECLKEKNKKELEDKKKRIKLELILLQERISPHFLYNTLASIKCVYKDEKLNSVIDSMVKYYRVALNKGSHLITIKDELSGIREYLKIQMFTYGKNFSFSIDCDSEIENTKILKNILQPIVENAFLHGVNLLSDDSGIINVNVEKENDDIVFMVYNNGPEISEEAILNIEKKCEAIDDNEQAVIGNGYGIANIIKRIQLYYGKEYGLKAYRQNGTVIKINIPFGKAD